MAILAALLTLCLVGLAWAQHGGGGGHGGGFGGHGGFGHVGGGRANSAYRGNGSSSHSAGTHHHNPFGFFHHFHHENAFRICESFGAACGDAYGVVDCGFWDWRCPKAAPVTTGPSAPGATSANLLEKPLGTSPDSPGTHSLAQGASSHGASTAMPVIWLKGGYSYELEDYWLQDGQLHYRTSYGGENSVPLDRIDLERTNEDNSQRGTQFKLNPEGVHATSTVANQH
jgi:hypothetical protein